MGKRITKRVPVAVFAIAFVAAAVIIPAAAAGMAAEIVYDSEDEDYEYTIVVTGIEPQLTESQLESGLGVVKVVDVETGQPAALDTVLGGVKINQNVGYDIIHCFGHFDPSRQYRVIVLHDDETQSECLVIKKGDFVAATSNWAVDWDLAKFFDWDLDLYIPEDVQGFGIAYDLKLLSLPRRRPWRLEVTSDGLLTTQSDATSFQSLISGGANFQYLRHYPIPVYERTAKGKEKHELKYYYGVRVDVPDVETDQRFDDVDYTGKVRLLAYFPGNVLSYWLFTGLKAAGLVTRDRPTLPPYILAGYTRVLKSETEADPAPPARKVDSRIDAEGKWILPVADNLDLHATYAIMRRIGDFDPGLKKFEEHFDLRAVFDVDSAGRAKIVAGYQQGKTPPLYRYAETAFAGFAVQLF